MKRSPKLTVDVLAGLTTLLGYATAGGPDEIGIDWHPHREGPYGGFGSAEAEREWEQVEEADAWLYAVLAHQRGEVVGDRGPHLPAAVLRGLDLALMLAEPCLDSDEADDAPQFSAARRTDFHTARLWVAEQERKKVNR